MFEKNWHVAEFIKIIKKSFVFLHLSLSLPRIRFSGHCNVDRPDIFEVPMG